MALSTKTASELTAEQVVTTLIKPLEQSSLFLAAGPKIIDTAGPLRMPKGPSAFNIDTWTGENELIPEKDTDFDEMQLLPSTMKSVKVITRYSNELVRQSIVNLDQALKERLVTDVATKIDTQLFSDQGDGITTPRGLFAYQGVQTIKTNSTTNKFSLDTLIDAQGMLLTANANVDAAKWVMNPVQFTNLRKVKDGSGHFILQPDVTRGAGFTLLGAPILITNRVAAGKLALVDFSSIVVARDVAPSVTFLAERYAEYDQHAIRVVTRLDAAPMTPESIVVIDNTASA